MTMGERAITSAMRTLSLISAALLTFGVLINFANVIGRYLLQRPIIWAEEAMSFSIIASVFFAVPVLAWSRRHMRMDVVISLLPRRSRTMLDLITDLALGVFTIAFAGFSFPVLKQVIESGQRSEALHLPMVLPHGLVPFGMGLMGLVILVRTALDLSRSSPSRDERDNAESATVVKG